MMKGIGRALMIALTMMVMAFLAVSCEGNIYLPETFVTITDGASSNTETAVGTDGTKSMVTAQADVAAYAYRLTPQWTANANGNGIYGSTGDTWKIVTREQVATNSFALGYVSQGYWKIEIRGLGPEYASAGDLQSFVNTDSNCLFKIVKSEYLNGAGSGITITLDDLYKEVTSGGNGTISLSNYKFTLVDSSSNYGTTFRLVYSVRRNDKGVFTPVVTDSVISSVITFDDVAGTATMVLSTNLEAGVYDVAVKLQEKVNGNWEDAGGCSCACVVFKNTTTVIKGAQDVALLPADFIAPGIVISSSESNDNVVEVWCAGSTRGSANNTVTLNKNGTYTFTSSCVVNGSAVNYSDYEIKWYVDGVQQSSTSTTFSFAVGSTAVNNKTVTCVFVGDGIDYLSANCYVKVI